MSEEKKNVKSCHFLNDLAKDIHQSNIIKGFYEEDKNLGEMLALIHSELSEVLEVIRVDEAMTSEKIPPHPAVGEELADVLIRVLDLSAHMGIDISSCVEAKMVYNWTRPHKHGKKF